MPDRRDIVINTGPLLALTAAGQLTVLSSLFRRVIVPAEVAREVAAGGETRFACDEFDAATWLDRRSEPTVLPHYLLTTLDRGEAAVIALALAKNIPTVCIDEVVGRRVARLHGLNLTGSLGLLIQARREGLAVSLRESVARMRQKSIWLSPALEAEAYRQAGE